VFASSFAEVKVRGVVAMSEPNHTIPIPKNAVFIAIDNKKEIKKV
jgi:hypothetical protein